MERYCEYKDSGVKWLGQIPSHWSTPRINQIGRYINGYAFKPKDWSVEKKKYFAPETEDFKIDSFALLAGSSDGTQDAEGEGTGGDSSGDDY